MSLKKLLLVGLLSLPVTVQAAQIYFIACTSDTTNTPNASASFTPTAGRLGVVTVTTSGTIDTMIATSSVGGQTYSIANDGVRDAYAGYPGTIANTIQVFVANQVYTAVSQTVTIDDPVTNGTGTNICIYELSGMSRVGTDAILQVASPDNDNSSGATPTSVFDTNALTTNPVLQAIIVGHAGSGTDITDPSGFTDTTTTIFHLTPSVANETFTDDSGFTSTTITAGGTYGDAGAATAVEFDASSTAPAFSVGPTEAPAADGFTISGTITGSGTLTVEAVACNPGDAVPTANEIEAGQCGGGNAALMNASEVWTDGVSNNFTLTSANKPVRFDVYVSGTNGTTDTAVTSLTDQDRSIRSGFLSVVMASHASDGICNLDSYFTPDCADGDVFEYEDDTNENADCNVSIAADGRVTLTPVAPGDCGGVGDRRTFEISYQDVSNTTDGLFTAPTVGNFTTDDTAAVNNPAPEFAGETLEWLWQKDVAIASEPLDPRWTDLDGDAITVTYQDALPTGLSNTAETLQGTPTACGSSSVTERGTDIFGDFDEVENTMVVGELVPDVADQDEASTIAEIEGFCSFTATAGTPEYSPTVALGETIRTEPEAGWLSPPDQEVIYFLSLGPQLNPDTWVSYARVWMFREVRRTYLTTTAFKDAVEADLRGDQDWTRWAPGTNEWSGSSNMQINVVLIPGVPALYDNGAVRP